MSAHGGRARLRRESQSVRGEAVVTPDILAALEHARAEKRPVVVGTMLPEGEQRLLPDPSASDALNEIAREVLISDVSGTHKIEGATGSCTPIIHRCGW